MGTIAEKLAYTKRARDEITAAIITKGVECPSTAPFCEFDEYILQIKSGGGGSSDVDYKDIFNHGDVVGLNPLYSVTHAKNQLSSSWIASSSKIYINQTGNANFTLVYPMILDNFNYICFEADASGKNGNYNYSTVGVRKLSSGLPSDYYGSCNYAAKNLTMFSNQTNYDGTSPWYNLTRQVIKVPVSAVIEPCMVSMSCCDCAVNIYSIWLE